MEQQKRRWTFSLGVVLAVAGLLAASASATFTGVGLATDVSPPADEAGQADPPASFADDEQGAGTEPETLPAAGEAGALGSPDWRYAAWATLLAGLGLTFAGAGLLVRERRRVDS